MGLIEGHPRSLPRQNIEFARASQEATERFAIGGAQAEASPIDGAGMGVGSAAATACSRTTACIGIDIV
jgi:hypothetical protein